MRLADIRKADAGSWFADEFSGLLRLVAHGVSIFELCNVHRGVMCVASLQTIRHACSEAVAIACNVSNMVWGCAQLYYLLKLTVQRMACTTDSVMRDTLLL
jgi:hypothetical protein